MTNISYGKSSTQEHQLSLNFIHSLHIFIHWRIVHGNPYLQSLHWFKPLHFKVSYIRNTMALICMLISTWPYSNWTQWVKNLVISSEKTHHQTAKIRGHFWILLLHLTFKDKILTLNKQITVKSLINSLLIGICQASRECFWRKLHPSHCTYESNFLASKLLNRSELP